MADSRPITCSNQRCQVELDIDGYHNESQLNHVGRVHPITTASYFTRVKDALKVDLHQIPALVGNTGRFIVYLVLAVVFPLGLLVGALNKKEDGSRDLGLVYRRCYKNLKFMVANVGNILKHALASIPILSTLAIALYNRCQRTRTVSRGGEDGGETGGAADGAAAELLSSSPTAAAVNGASAAVIDGSAPTPPPVADQV